jgi:tight adherence protein C
MVAGIALIVVALLALGILVVTLISSRKVDPIASRVEEIRTERSATPATMYTAAGMVVVPSAPNQTQVEAARRARNEQAKPTLRDRLMQAGLYRAYSPATFAIVRVVLALCPLGLALIAGLSGQAPLLLSLILGAVVAGLGTLAPSFWLDHLKSARQKKLRRALPDALDVIVVCLEGGLSLTGAFTRVAQELIGAHPLLAMELRIVQREVQMGRSTGEALRAFAKRFDLEELRSLAGVITQAEKFGTSVVRALGVYAESMRLRRHQKAEELAHQATIKMIFPTLLCIFPAIFVVILGPAAIRIYDTFILKTPIGGL